MVAHVEKYNHHVRGYHHSNICDKLPCLSGILGDQSPYTAQAGQSCGEDWVANAHIFLGQLQTRSLFWNEDQIAIRFALWHHVDDPG